jgi:putative spermidine/putrescine transport system permease protein
LLSRRLSLSAREAGGEGRGPLRSNGKGEVGASAITLSPPSRGLAPAASDLRLSAPLAAFFALFFLAPLALLFFVSLFNDTGMTSVGLAQYAKFAFDSFNRSVLIDTLALGVYVTLLCLVFGYPLAWVFCRVGPRLQAVLILIIMMPLLTSVVVRTFAWIVILGRQGIVNSLLLNLGLAEAPLRLLYTQGGLVVALAQVQMPLMVLPLINAMQRLDANLVDASSALGAGHWRTFRRVTLPLSLPGIIAGCLLTYAAAVTAFITQTLIGGGQMLFMPSFIYQQAIGVNNWPFAAAISIVFMVTVLAIVAAFNAVGRLSRGYTRS